MKTAYGYPTPRDTTKGFGSYTPWNEPEMQQYFAQDVLRVVRALLAGGTQGGDLSNEAVLSAGALLDAAMEVLERQGLLAWKETEANLTQLAQLKASAL